MMTDRRQNPEGKQQKPDLTPQKKESKPEVPSGAGRDSRANLEGAEGQADLGREGPGAMASEHHHSPGQTGPMELGREGLGDRREAASGDMLAQRQEGRDRAEKLKQKEEKNPRSG